MASFIYRCPTTAKPVQAWIAEDVGEEPGVYVPIQCLACRQFHHVNPMTGKVLGVDLEDNG